MKAGSLRAAWLVPVVLGVLVVVLWVRLAGGEALVRALSRVNPLYVPALLSLTVACVGLRFIRWQYLLRRIGVRVPTRRSGAVYLASLAGIATPAYLGETIRSVLLRRSAGAPVRATLSAWVIERLLDFAAIGLLGVAALAGGWWAVGGLVLAAAIAAALRAEADEGLPGLRRPAVLLPGLGLTVLAWLPATLIVGLSARALGVPLDLIEGVRVFAAATFGGGLSLMPAGIGTTGSFAILQLNGLGVADPDAVAIVSLFRLATAGITLAVGGVFLLHELRAVRRSAIPAQHFDEIADDYLDQFAPHIWDLLLERKTALICSALPPAGQGAIGVDLGCGLGRQALALKARGYRIVGLDPAHALLRFGAGQGLAAAAGSGTALPFRDGSIDFVYTVGVLHHLTGQGDQQAALREVARVLRPGGVLVVHETNPRNPVFRLYMGYVFPVLKSIDEGIERWIDPASWRRVQGLALERVEYFTFLPDFLPRALLRAVLPVERWLERSRLRPWSVHYMAVLRRRDVAQVPAAPDRMVAVDAIA